MSTEQMNNTPLIPDMITLCNYENDGKTCINPSQVAALHDIPKCDRYERRTRVDMSPAEERFGYSPAGSFLVKETAVYIRNAMDARRLRAEKQREQADSST